MSKYGIVRNGKVDQYRFKKTDLGYNFYLGDEFIGQIMYSSRGEWSSIPWGDINGLRLVEGFKTRHGAVDYMLKVKGITQ